MIQVYPSPFDTTSLSYLGVPTRNSPLSTYSYVSSTAFTVGVCDHSTKWGTSHVFYDTYLSATQGYRYSHILFYGGGRLWPSGFDPNVTGLIDTYGEYDNSATLKHAIQQAVDQGQPIYLNLNCLVPTFYRAPGVTAGWTGFEQASPDPVNHDKIASVYSSVVSYFLPSGIVGVTVGSELKGMYSTQPCATVGIPQGWDIPRYWNLYEKIYDKVKAVDTGIKVYGPYLQFYDNLPDDPTKRINISGVYVRDECVSALNEFIASASVDDKYDGVGFDAVMPVSAWPTLIRYVREKMAPGKHVIVTECYKDPLVPVNPKDDDITTALLQAIEDNLQPNDRAFVWGDPQFFSSAPLILPSIATPSSAFVYKCGSTSAWASWENGPGVYGAGVTGAAQNSLAPWKNKTATQFNYLNFDTDYPTRIKVGYKKGPVTSVDICPHRKNYQYSIVAPSTIEILGISPYDKVVITVNNDLSTPLYVFANPIEAAPDPTSVNLYFSAGIWEISALNTAFGLDTNPSSNFRYQIPFSNYNVYIAPGAYIDGTLSVRGKNNINIYGRGVIDAYRPDDWWQRWSWEAPGNIIDADKLIRAPILAWSSFNEQYDRNLECSNIYINGITLVNSITYATTVNAKSFDNLKLISQWPNCDGFRPDDLASSDPNKFCSLTRSFMQVADDAMFPRKATGNCIVSSCYVISLAGATFRDYYGMYNSKYINGQNYGWSALDIDFKSYASPSYAYKSSPLYDVYNNAVFGLWQSEKSKFIPHYGSSFSSILVGDIFISGVYADNLIDIPVFDVGIRSYPDSDGQARDYTEVFGNMSSITFKDVYVSSHPNSAYNWTTKRNRIFGTENSNRYRPYDLSFININIDGVTLTETNKNNYFDWYYKAPLPDIAPTLPSYIGSSIVDLYLILGDSIAYGASSFYADRANTSYADMPSELTGCYIFRPGRAYDQTGLPAGDWPKFDVIRPGVNTNQLDYPLAPKDTYGDTGLESLLAWKLRQNSGDRDIYIVKCAVGGTMALSGTSATWGPTTDWSVSSSGEMFSKFTASATAAINILKNQNKNINFAGAVICLGTNVPIQAQRYTNNVTATPNPYYNPSLVSSLINTDLSSLVSGIRGVIGSPSLNVDTFYSKFIWVAPQINYGSVAFDDDYYAGYGHRFRSKLQQLSSAIAPSSSFVSIRTDYYLPPTGTGPAVGGTSPFLADYVHYNFSGYAKIADDILFNLKLRNRSVTDPTLNPEVNYQFYPKPAVEIYDNPFEAEKTFTLYNNNNYQRTVSSAYYNVSIYDANLGTYVSSFVYRCGHDRFYAPWSQNVWNVHGSGNPVDDGYKIGLAPWGPSAAGSFNYTNFGISGPVNIKIDYKRPPRNGALQTSDISIGPFVKNKQFTIQNTSSIIIENVYPYDKLAVEVKYDTSNPLFVFANPYREARPTVYVTPTTLSATAGSPGDTIYFGPGFYEFSSFASRNYVLPVDDNKVSSLPKWSFSAQDNQTLYIDAGAYIRGNIDIRYASGVTIAGYGVIEPYWLQDFYERIEPVHEDKLRLAPFRGYSIFADAGNAETRSRHANLRGITVANNVSYFNTSKFRNIDNIKYFGQYMNADGPRFGDYPAWTPQTYPDGNTIQINGSSTYTRSFQIVGDDGFTNIANAPAMSLLVSSIYCWNLAATVFRTYHLEYSFKEGNPTKNIIGAGFSAFDIDVRNYASYAYNLQKSAPINNKSKLSIFGLWYSPQREGAYSSEGLNDVLVSGLRVENPTDIPLLDIGFRYYPFINSSPDLGSSYTDWKAFPLRKGRISNITLADISISSHPSSIGKYVYSNAIFGEDRVWGDTG